MPEPSSEPVNFVGLDPVGLLFICIAFAIALAMAYLLTPIASRLAVWSRAMDEPDAGRRIHLTPIPRAGGLAVLVAFLVVGIVATVLQERLGLYGLVDGRSLAGRLLDEGAALAVFGGAILAGVFGFIDDVLQLRARWQLVFQLVLAATAVAFGVTIVAVASPLGLQLSSTDPGPIAFGGPVAVLVTVLWIVGMINSINFIDGLDGLSTGVALIAALTLCFVSLGFESSYQAPVALLCAVLAGALAGFLPWNFHPARIFVGTTGVMVVGYLLAVLSVLGSAKIAVALLILGVPIIDTFWVITRRLLKRQSPFTPDRSHLHHRLLDLGLSHKGAVILIYVMTAALAVLSLVLARGPGPLYAFVLVVIGSGVVLLVLTFRAGRDDALEAGSYPDE